MIPVPVMAKSTVWLPITGSEALAVTVIMVVPASEPVLVLTERLTRGKSLSVMVTVWEVVLPNSKPEEMLLMLIVAVSGPSTSVSLTMVKVLVPVVPPLGMLMMLLLRV